MKSHRWNIKVFRLGSFFASSAIHHRNSRLLFPRKLRLMMELWSVLTFGVYTIFVHIRGKSIPTQIFTWLTALIVNVWRGKEALSFWHHTYNLHLFHIQIWFWIELSSFNPFSIRFVSFSFKFLAWLSIPTTHIKVRAIQPWCCWVCRINGYRYICRWWCEVECAEWKDLHRPQIYMIPFANDFLMYSHFSWIISKPFARSSSSSSSGYLFHFQFGLFHFFLNNCAYTYHIPLPCILCI